MATKHEITVTVNGQQYHSQVEPRMLLVHYLRDELDLTGTHIGCDTSQCGACTVLLNGESVKACTVLAVQADGSEVTTIEGLAPEGSLHPIQEPNPGRLLGETRSAMWLLYSWNDNGFLSNTQGQSQPDRN